LKVEEVHKLLDRYSRVARLYPAVLAIAPVIWTIALIRPRLAVGDVARGLVSLVVLLGGLYFLASIGRWRGKILEPRLIAAWGGWPTTILLRHRDLTIDRFTKARYHEQIRGLRRNLSLPSIQEEEGNPREADERYRSATKYLIELRRGPEYGILHQENASYGFRRNLLGLKPVGIGVTAVMAATVALLWWKALSSPARFQGLLSESLVRFYIAFAANAAYLIIWSVVVSVSFVRQAANEYAEALLKTLE
jgi:hypothetical protein